MALVPVSREEMLMRQSVDAHRIKKIKDAICILYSGAVRVAENTTNTMFYFELTEINRDMSTDFGSKKYPEYYLTNMTEIINGLQDLFPGCFVGIKDLTLATDGYLYDMSRMSESFVMKNSKNIHKECIVIDWS